MKPILLAVAMLALTAQAEPPMTVSRVAPGQLPAPLETDTSYDASVAAPAYRTRHPRVLFDEGHHDFHTPGTRYRPFAELIRNDGYSIASNPGPFTAQALAGHDVLIIANAMGATGVDAYWTSAFTEEECRVVGDWVRGGGALLLIADHAPFGAAAERLAQAFGVDMSKGVTTDRDHADPESHNLTFILYTHEGQGIGNHPILEGRGPNERIGRVMAFSGQSLRGPEGSSALLRLGEAAMDRPTPSETQIRDAVAAARAEAQREGQPDPGAIRLQGQMRGTSAAGRAQAVAFRFGRGRVVVLGEAAMLSAQRTAEGQPVGLNRPGLDNRQFALNVMHWLSGLLD